MAFRSERLPAAHERYRLEERVPRSARERPSLTFDEDMRGTMATADGVKPLSVHLTIGIGDMDRFVADTNHLASATGVVHAPSLGGDLAITAGRFRLFPVNPETHQREMRYDLPFEGADHKRYELHGTKFIHDDPGFDAWHDLTHLHTRIVGPGGQPVGQGVISLGVIDVLKLGASMRAPRPTGVVAKVKTFTHFLGFAAKNIIDTYVRPKLSGR